MSDSLQPHVAQQAPLPWDAPNKNAAMGCPSLSQGIFPQVVHITGGLFTI